MSIVDGYAEDAAAEEKLCISVNDLTVLSDVALSFKSALVDTSVMSLHDSRIFIESCVAAPSIDTTGRSVILIESNPPDKQNQFYGDFITKQLAMLVEYKISYGDLNDYLAEQSSETTDSATNDHDDLYDYCSDSGYRWAEKFCEYAQRLGPADVAPDWATAWFANAIEHSCAVRRWAYEKQLDQLRDTCDCSVDYNRGLANGLILARSISNGTEPDFVLPILDPAEQPGTRSEYRGDVATATFVAEMLKYDDGEIDALTDMLLDPGRTWP